MENEPSAAQNAAYDYRTCERVWHRVDPTLTPYPEARAAMAVDTADDGLTAAERQAELSLPGAQADPCCMGSVAMESLEVLQGFLREELADRRTYLYYRTHFIMGGGSKRYSRGRKRNIAVYKHYSV